MRSQFVRPLELDFLVDFVNDFADEPRIRSGEAAGPYPDLADVAGGAPMALGVVQAIHGDRMRAQLIQLADRLHVVFATARSAPAGAVELVNDLLQESPAIPHLSLGANRTIADWRLESVDRQSGSIGVLQAACALTLHEWLTGAGSLDRLGVCSAHQCADIYVDGSQAASRRYCSASCGNRVKVAAHRARNRPSSRVPG